MVCTRQQLTHVGIEAAGGAEEARGAIVGCRLSGDAGGEEAVRSTCQLPGV